MNNRFVFFVACCALALAITVGAVHRAQADPAILNGSFEDPVLAPNDISAGGGTFWTANNANVFIVSNNFASLGVTPYGNQYLAFSSPAASDQQTVSGFLAGQDYVLDLFFADIGGNQNPQLTVMITGAATATGVFNAPVSGPNGSNPYPFQQAQVPFTTTADGNITVALIDTGSASVAVDNVSIAAVPEVSPAVSMLLLSATMAAGFLSRFRHRASSRLNLKD